jgi:hypothetical protein
MEGEEERRGSRKRKAGGEIGKRSRNGRRGRERKRNEED